MTMGQWAAESDRSRDRRPSRLRRGREDLIDPTLQRLLLADASRGAPGLLGSQTAGSAVLPRSRNWRETRRDGRRPGSGDGHCLRRLRLLKVSDAAADQPPTPAQGRDPAQGGLGHPGRRDQQRARLADRPRCRSCPGRRRP